MKNGYKQPGIHFILAVRELGFDRMFAADRKHLASSDTQVVAAPARTLKNG